MKGTKTSLFLIELMIALLLFAFCAAICVQLFHASNKRTESAEDLSKAVFHATTVAEQYKAFGGDLEAIRSEYDKDSTWIADTSLSLYFDGDWNSTITPMLSSALPSSGFTVSIFDNGDSSADIIVYKLVEAHRKEGGGISSTSEGIFEITVKAVAS